MAAQNRKILVSRPAQLGILINKGMEDYVCTCKEPIELGTTGLKLPNAIVLIKLKGRFKPEMRRPEGRLRQGPVHESRLP
jgi:hypothetical protein